jgi:diaminopimelate epimerase
MKRLKFYKYQGAGNDFILIEDFSEKYLKFSKSQIQNLCHRNYGIGSDGLILLRKSRISHAKMHFFNPDGQGADLCGNGSRCAVAHLKDARVTLETTEGIILGENHEDAVAIKLPRTEEIMSPIAVDGDRIGHLFHTGVPHLIIMVNDLENGDFEKHSQTLRYSEMFQPEGVNVSFLKISDGSASIRTYERGVEGETLACGTACAAAALLMRKNDKKKKSQYTVYPKSLNPLQFTFDNQDNIWMRGSALKVFEGEINIPNLVNETVES